MLIDKCALIREWFIAPPITTTHFSRLTSTQCTCTALAMAHHGRPHHFMTQYLKKNPETQGFEKSRERTAEQATILKEVASHRSDTRTIVGYCAEPIENSRVIC